MENFQAFFSFYQGNWTPLTWFFHALTYAVVGLEPWGHHGINILLHCFNTLWLFILALQVITIPSTTTTKQQALFTASLIALWFGLHPQHVEAVAWAAASKDVLSLFFILATFVFYLFSFQNQKFRMKGYLLALFCFSLALLSKPIAMTVPLILLLLDVYPLQRFSFTGIKKEPYGPILLEKIPFFLLGGISFLITVFAQYEGGAITELSVFGVNERLLNAANSIILYLSKLFFPVFLSPMYPLSKELSLFPVVAIFLITGLCIYGGYKKQDYWLVAWLFYLVTLLPVLGLIQIGGHASADRFAYLPTLPFYFLAGIGITKLFYLIQFFNKLVLLIFLAAISSGLFHLTRQQTLIWKNDLTLWNYAAFYAPDSSLIQGNLGHSYLAQGDYQKALQQYQLALAQAEQRMYYDIGAVYYHSAVAKLKLGQYQEALAIFNDIVTHHRSVGQPFEVIYYQIAWIYTQLSFVTRAKSALHQALTMNPQYQVAKDLLMQLH